MAGVALDKRNVGSCGPAHLHGNIPTESQLAQRMTARAFRAHTRASDCTFALYTLVADDANSSVRIPPVSKEARTAKSTEGEGGPRTTLKKCTFEDIAGQKGSQFPRGTRSDRYFLFREGLSRGLPAWKLTKTDRGLLFPFGCLSLGSNETHTPSRIEDIGSRYKGKNVLWLADLS